MHSHCEWQVTNRRDAWSGAAESCIDVDEVESEAECSDAEIFDHDPENGRLDLTEPMSESNHQLSAAKL
jgi:hypothetical protein